MPVTISEKNRGILRKLAEEVAKIAALPIQKQTFELWRRLNDLKKTRPLVDIFEIPWQEMDVNGELELKTDDEFCRGIESALRFTIYQWKHLKSDIVVEGKFYSPLAITDTGFGIHEEVRYISKDPKSSIKSREYHPQIQSEKDLDKIKTPRITFDKETTEGNYQTLVKLFGDILPIEKRGVSHFWFAPWDELVTWWGVNEALTDLIDKPDLVHMAMDRLVTAHLSRLKQLEDLHLLCLPDGIYKSGSGGPACTSALPQKDFNPEHIRTVDMWGSATAQIFSEVSPAMYDEFALRYEKQWLSRFGLTYYGCCEPLHNKLDLLKSVPNLRKISMSAWANVDKFVEKAGKKYVISHKPNPSVLATNTWNPGMAKRNLEEVLEKTRGCTVEIIMKDISTVNYEPQRIWEWSEIAMETAEKYA